MIDPDDNQSIDQSYWLIKSIIDQFIDRSLIINHLLTGWSMENQSTHQSIYQLIDQSSLMMDPLIDWDQSSDNRHIDWFSQFDQSIQDRSINWINQYDQLIDQYRNDQYDQSSNDLIWKYTAISKLINQSSVDWLIMGKLLIPNIFCSYVFLLIVEL